MAFPAVPRVVYQVNPLDEVICQLRFPPILKIDTEPPAAFQERIRANYPLYEMTSPLKLPANMPPAVAQLVAAELPFAGQKNHTFRSKDGNWSVTLNREFVALTCRMYERWEAFRDRLSTVFAALVELYDPAHFTRLGLRYRDVIQPSKFGLPGTPWSELLRPEVCGLAGHPDIVPQLQQCNNQAVLRLGDDSGSIVLNTFLAVDAQTDEPLFVIDSDFATDDPMENDRAIPHLETFKRHATNFFRWCITDRLHHALRPVPVEASA